MNSAAASGLRFHPVQRFCAILLVVLMIVAVIVHAPVWQQATPYSPEPAPIQRWGDANGLSHVTDSPVNRELPASLRAAYPLFTGMPEVPARNAAEVVAAPAVAQPAGFNAATSVEIGKTATTTTYANVDGTNTTAFAAGDSRPLVTPGKADSGMYVHGGSSTPGGSELWVGKHSGPSASYLKFDAIAGQLQNHTIYGAQLQLANFDSGSCRPRPTTVHPVTETWSANGNYSYANAPSVGASIASSSFAHGYIATGQSASACPAAGVLVDLGVGGRNLLQRWVNGQQANYGLSLRASDSDGSAAKKFAGTTTANPPKLFVTHTPYNATYAIPKPLPDPPVLQNQAGKVKVTVTNRGAEAWQPGAYYLAYRAYNVQTGQPAGQHRAANLTATVNRGASVTLDATIQPLPPGRYFLDFTMVRTGGAVFTDHQVPPGRIVLQVFDIPPVLQELFPPNGYQAPTLTPQLWARAVDTDAPPGSTLRYKFEVCERDANGNPTDCADSGYLTSPVWTVPAAKFVWSKIYLWRAFVKDANNEVISPHSAIITAVPQPEITSRIAAAPYGTQDREFDAQVGNFSTAALDVPVTTVGPQLNIMRSYNSLDPRRDAMFGAGWITRYDMRIRPDNDGSGNVVVTYPDGQEVRFGRNPNGTFAAPMGRTASLTIANSGWLLKDAAGTAYQFNSGQKLASITDFHGRMQELTYNPADGKLTKVSMNTSLTSRSGRTLRFTWTGNRVSSVASDPVGGLASTWNYTYTGDLLTKVCAPGNACTTYTYAPGSHYRSSVLDAKPESYWRLGEAQGTSASSEIAVNLGKDAATYKNTTNGTAGPLAGTNNTAATFNGTTSMVDLPKGALKKSRDQSIELWFKASTTGTGGPLIGYQDKATAPAAGVPLLYVDTNGKLRGQFAGATVAPMVSAASVNDGRWHHAVLSVMGNVQILYLDGAQAARLEQPVEHSTLTFNQVGSAYAVNPATWPAWGTTQQRFFNGAIDEVAVYSHPLGPATVNDHFRYGTQQADQLTRVTLPSGKVIAEAEYDTALDRIKQYTDRNGGTWQIGAPTVYGGDTDLRRSVQVLDPGNRPYLYEYDAIAGWLLRTGKPAGLEIRPEDQPGEPTTPPTPPVEACGNPDPGDPQFCTIIPGNATGPVFVRHPLEGMAIRSFTYDERGQQTKITNEVGNSTSMAYDDRGNVVTKQTCRTKTSCQIAYYKYRTGTVDPFDPTANLPLEVRDGRSTSATDNTFVTRYTYTPAGDLESQTNPDGGRILHEYTKGIETGFSGGNVPAGLIAKSTDPTGAVTTYAYFQNGDLARVTQQSGLITDYTYDALGRKSTEKEVSDTYPNGIVTLNEYDTHSRVLSTTEPATTNAVIGVRHQEKVTNTYDADGNIIKVESVDLLGGDQARASTTDFDEHNRPQRTIDAEGGETSFRYDLHGNQVSMVDPAGNRYDYAYTAANQIAEIRLWDWKGDPAGVPSTGDYLVLNSYSYDFAGRMTSDTDASGRRVEYDHYDDDLPWKTTLKNFHNPDGSTRVYIVEENTYDGAGNLTRQVTGNGRNITTNTIDKTGRVQSTIADPDGLARTTTFTYDLAGKVKQTKQTGKPSNVPWLVPAASEVVDFGYDLAGNQTSETATNGASTLTTSHTYDKRGMKTSTTDPRGNVTGADKAAFTATFSSDELGRQVLSTGPAVRAESNGGPAQSVSPVTQAGYNTFDEQTEAKDELGNVMRTNYDRLGRPVRAEQPSYQPPGGEPFTPAVVTKYDAVGNVIETIDPAGNSTRLTYDRLQRLVHRDAPATNNQRAEWRYTYTRSGKVLSVTDPTGGRVESTYDDLDRQITMTAVERRPVLDNLTTRYEYDDAGNGTAVFAPSGAKTTHAYNAVSELVKSTSPTGVVTEYGYDFTGRAIRTSDGLGRTSRSDFDLFGRLVSESDLAPNGQGLRSRSYAHDAAGNLTSATTELGRVTRFEYDAANQLTKQIEPVSDTASITTTFGYDTAGNRTRYTDGRNNSTIYTYNSLGLAESTIEPATQAHPALVDRTWTVAYDARGLAGRLTAPGGVARERSYDAAGQMTKETGSGAEAPTAQRDLGYDLLGRLTTVGTDTYAYNDRGMLLSTNGPSGTAAFAYDKDGNITERTDAAGTSRFGYDRGRLSTVTDGSTSATQTLGYNPAGQPSTVNYGANRIRTLDYDDLGRPVSDVLRNGAQQPVFSINYGYDVEDHLKTKSTAGTVGAGTNTYDYDYAGRLTSWNGKAYGWDDAGNRIKSDGATASFDERNRMLSNGSQTYTYSARGNVSNGSTFDAFDRLISQGAQRYEYDGLDRVISRNGTKFAYSGASDAVVSDGAERYSRGPSDELLATTEGQTKRLTLADEHDDVVGQFDPADTTLARLPDSTAFDPFGSVTATGGDRVNIGYQGDWTDPGTGQVDMGSRWYDPANGRFTSRDSVTYRSGDSVLANRYTYGAGAPLDHTDPDGNWPKIKCGWCSRVKEGIKTAASVAVGYVTTSFIWRAASFVVNRAWDVVKSTAKAVWKGVKQTANFIGRAVRGEVTWNEIRVKAAQRAQELTRKAKAVAAIAIKHNPLKIMAASWKPMLAGLKIAVSASVWLPAKVLSVTRDVVHDAKAQAQAIYRNLESRYSLIQNVSNAVQSFGDWVDAHKADIVGFAVGVGVGLGCGALIGWTGVGAVGCAALAGAVGSIAHDLVEGGHSWKEIGVNALVGGAIGAATAGLGPALGSLARPLGQGIRGALTSAASRLPALAAGARSGMNSVSGGVRSGLTSVATKAVALGGRAMSAGRSAMAAGGRALAQVKTAWDNYNPTRLMQRAYVSATTRGRQLDTAMETVKGFGSPGVPPEPDDFVGITTDVGANLVEVPFAVMKHWTGTEVPGEVARGAYSFAASLYKKYGPRSFRESFK